MGWVIFQITVVTQRIGPSCRRSRRTFIPVYSRMRLCIILAGPSAEKNLLTKFFNWVWKVRCLSVIGWVMFGNWYWGPRISRCSSRLMGVLRVQSFFLGLLAVRARWVGQSTFWDCSIILDEAVEEAEEPAIKYFEVIPRKICQVKKVIRNFYPAVLWPHKLVKTYPPPSDGEP